MGIQNETVQSLLTSLGINVEHTSTSLQLLAATDSRFLKDLKLNVNTVLNSTHINRKHAVLLALATVVNEKHTVLTEAFQNLARTEGATDTEISETYACASLMSANNVFYRFRHYMHQSEYYNKQPAGLRMSTMMNPVLGKEFFELMSLAVSALNGCERCVTSHENSVKQHGADEPRIYDAIRLVAVIKSLCVII